MISESYSGTIETVHLMEIVDEHKPNYSVRVVISTRYWPGELDHESSIYPIHYETRKLSYEGDNVLAFGVLGEPSISYQNMRYRVYEKHYDACKNNFG